MMDLHPIAGPGLFAGRIGSSWAALPTCSSFNKNAIATASVPASCRRCWPPSSWRSKAVPLIPPPGLPTPIWRKARRP